MLRDRGVVVISIRSFRNDDLPAIAEIWNRQAPCRARLQPMTCPLFEREVLSKPFFDRHGLLVAVADGDLVGFVHGAFAADSEGAQLSREMGVICTLQVTPRADRCQIADLLLRQSESRLAAEGAKRFLGGCARPADPFYGGLYGGCIALGVLDSDEWLLRFLRAAGYASRRESLVLRCATRAFRPRIHRGLLQIRRTHVVRVDVDPPAANWWEACQRGNAQVTRLTLSSRHGQTNQTATVALWEHRGQTVERTAGIVDWTFHDPTVMDGAAEFLLAEAVRRSRREGADWSEMQLGVNDTTMLELAQRLGFEVVDRAFSLDRIPGPSNPA